MNAQVCTRDGEWLSLDPLLWNAPDAGAPGRSPNDGFFMCITALWRVWETCVPSHGSPVDTWILLKQSTAAHVVRRVFTGLRSHEFASKQTIHPVLSSFPVHAQSRELGPSLNSCALSRPRSGGILGFLTVACKNPLQVCTPPKHGFREDSAIATERVSIA